MKLISNTDRRIVKYVHVRKNLEGLSYTLRPYPQSSHMTPQLKDWQVEVLMEALEFDAERFGLVIRH